MHLVDLIKQYDNDSWHNFIYDKRVLKELEKIEENIKNDYYPLKEDIFKFLENDLYNVKYIFFGMDPYLEKNIDGKPYATGRAFEVCGYDDWTDKTRKSSLNNLLKKIYLSVYKEDLKVEEIREKIKNDEFKILSPNNWFIHMETEGVLFLNFGLTVNPKKSGSHLKYWNGFMSLLIKYIYENNDNVKWILLGEKVQKRFDIIAKNVIGKNYKDYINDKIIKSYHPSTKEFIKDKNNIFDLMSDIDLTGYERKSIKY